MFAHRNWISSLISLVLEANKSAAGQSGGESEITSEYFLFTATAHGVSLIGFVAPTYFFSKAPPQRLRFSSLIPNPPVTQIMSMSAEAGTLPDTFLRSCATSLVGHDDAFNTFMRAYYSLLVGRMMYECVNASIVIPTASFEEDARAA
jgi:hypothetical protein